MILCLIPLNVIIDYFLNGVWDLYKSYLIAFMLFVHGLYGNLRNWKFMTTRSKPIWLEQYSRNKYEEACFGEQLLHCLIFESIFLASRYAKPW